MKPDPVEYALLPAHLPASWLRSAGPTSWVFDQASIVSVDFEAGRIEFDRDGETVGLSLPKAEFMMVYDPNFNPVPVEAIMRAAEVRFSVRREAPDRVEGILITAFRND